MSRFLILFACIAFLPSLALARDDGGFGDSFTKTAPSALMESPDSQVAQSVPSPASAQDMQAIMPAAGDETQSPADAKTPKDAAKASQSAETPVK